MSGSDRTERLEATVRGSVQGVGFRWFVVRNASQLGVTGWTSNESDGSVRVVAEGVTLALDRLEWALREGPSGAHVVEVIATRTQPTGEFARFDIRSGAHRGD